MAFIISLHRSAFIHAWHTRIKPWLITYLVTQSIITAVSLPFLLAWGLPVSLASPIGNLLFVPFISLFLLLSSLFFMWSLLATPPALLVWALDVTAHLWQMILSWGSQSWLLAIPCPPWWVLGIYGAALIYATVFQGWYRIFNYPYRIIFGSIAGIFFLWSAGKLMHPTAPNILDEKLTISQCNDGTLRLHDRGYFCQPGCPINRVCYKLKSYLTSHYGLPTISCCTVENLTQKTCDGLKALCCIAQVTQIRIPHPASKERTRRFWGAWYAFKKTAEKNGTKIWYTSTAAATEKTAIP